MDFEEGKPILVNTIKCKLRHRDYPRVVKIAEDYKALTTGENARRHLKRFNPREDEPMFEQRVELTQITTPDTINSLMKPMFKVGRTVANIKLAWDKSESDNEKRRQEIQQVANSYFGETSLSDYLATRMPQLDCTDPNSFIITELEGVVNPNDATATKLNPYPYEACAAEAINFNYRNNKLEWLILLGESNFGERYTMYLTNETIVATEIDPQLNIVDEETYLAELAAGPMPNAREILTIEIESTETNAAPVPAMPDAHATAEAQRKKDKSKRRFILQVMEPKGGRVPAFRVGHNLDLVTEGRTCVPLIHPAMPYLLKAVKTISEFDLTNCLHVFPQKVMYVKMCNGKPGFACNNGRTAIGAVCEVCKGSGEETVHKSAQDVITFRMPKDLKDMVPLDNLFVYKYPPIDLLKFQEQLGLITLRERAQAAVYNSDIFTKAQFQETATASNIDYESVQDTLKPFADHFSACYRHTMILIATFRDHGAGFQVTHKLPKDLKMKSLGQLVTELKSLNDSGAPAYLKQEITMDITRQVYVDRPEEIKKLEIKNKFFPFPGKTDAQINYVVSNKLTKRHNAILWAEFDSIFQAIEFEFTNKNLDFYATSQQVQQLAIKAKVLDIIAAQDEEEAERTAIAFNDTASNDTEGEEANNNAANAGAAEGGTVADTALNGAQVSAIVEMCLQVTQEGLPLDTVKAIIMAAFPLVPVATIEKITKPLANFVPKKVEDPATPPPFNNN